MIEGVEEKMWRSLGFEQNEPIHLSFSPHHYMTMELGYDRARRTLERDLDGIFGARNLEFSVRELIEEE